MVKADSTGAVKSSPAFVPKMAQDTFKSSGHNFNSEMPMWSLATLTSVMKK